jgi:catechol 2,3-dioxygenase
MQQIDAGHVAGTPENWKWPPGRLDYWGISGHPSEHIEEAGLHWHFSDDGWRLDEWRS